MIHYRPLCIDRDQLRPWHSSSSVIGDEHLRSPSSGDTQEPEQEMIETSSSDSGLVETSIALCEPGL